MGEKGLVNLLYDPMGPLAGFCSVYFQCMKVLMTNDFQEIVSMRDFTRSTFSF